MAPGDMRDTGGQGGVCWGSLHIEGTSQGHRAAGLLTKPAPCRQSSGAAPLGLGRPGRGGMQSEASQVAMGEILQFYLKRIKAPNPGPRCCFSLENINLFFNVGLFILAFKA